MFPTMPGSDNLHFWSRYGSRMSMLTQCRTGIAGRRTNLAILFASIVTLLTSCRDTTHEHTSVKVRLKSVQVQSDFATRATFALAVPQDTGIRIHLFDGPGFDCASTLDESAVAELYIPGSPEQPMGVKFHQKDKPSWATSLNPGKAPPFSDVRRSAERVTGCIDADIDLQSAGNTASIHGCFNAALCPARSLSGLAATKGSSTMEISMTTHQGTWTTRPGAAIAFAAEDRLMVFFQDTGILTCENYRLVPKQGLIEFATTPARTSYFKEDLVKVAPVDPKSGWSFHYGADLFTANAATAVIDRKDNRVKGTVDATFRGLDRQTLSVKYPHGAGFDHERQVTGHIQGEFDAPLCPEF